MFTSEYTIMHLKGRPSNYLLQLFLGKEAQIKRIAYSQMFDHVYGTCVTACIH